MDESKLLWWMTRLWCFLILPSILSNRILNMDELSSCGQNIEVFETPILINARSSVSTPNPPQFCQIIMETTSRDGAYRLQITIKSVAIKDSSFMLRIYDGQGAIELLRQIGSSSKSTDIIYTKSSYATIILTRSRELRYPENDFTLEVKGYRDPDEAVPVIGGSKLKPPAIVGIVLGIVLLIGFGAVLCFMYNTGILTRKHSGVPSSHSAAGSKESLKASSISSISSRKGYPGREDSALSSAFLSSVTAKFSSNGNVSRSGSGRSPKLPPSRAEVRTLSDKDEYEEPISTRRNGKTSSVTFDTRQQQPQFFQRGYTGAGGGGGGGGSQNGQRSPKSSMAKSKYGVPDRSSGHSNASYAEIKDYPYLSSNSKESTVPSKKSSQSPRSSLHSSSRDTGNGLISEGSSQTSIQKESSQKKTHADLLKEINSFNTRKLSNSDAADKEKSSGNGQQLYSTVNKTKPTNPENIKQSNGFQDEDTNFKSVSPEAVITKPSNQSVKTQNGKPPPYSGSANSEQEKLKKNQNSLDEDEDENDREVRNIHANTTTLNDEEFSSNDSFTSKPDEPALMTNPRVNNNYIRNSIDDPSVQQNNAKNTQNPPDKKHRGRKVPKTHSEDNDSYPENNIPSEHSHYGIPELVEKTPQNPINVYGFPSAFNAILSRTVKPDPNKTIEYGYHTQTNESNDESGKAAWYIESAPTKSGPIKTSAFFLQTSQPNQKNESVYGNDPSRNGNQFGPEHTSTPVSTFQPGGPVTKPKAKPRNRSSTNSENPKDHFPLSIPQPEKGLSKGKSGQKSAVVKSGYDPNTGCQTTQVLWTDSIPDPTDPDPEMDNPCITRKTVNRITTRSTYGNLPENPFPLLNQIQMESNEPSFLSPSVVSSTNMLPSTEYAAEIPRPEEISFYTQPSRNQSQAPVIHDSSHRHHNIKDRMTIA